MSSLEILTVHHYVEQDTRSGLWVVYTQLYSGNQPVGAAKPSGAYATQSEATTAKNRRLRRAA
jgi:hypothetical protein